MIIKDVNVLREDSEIRTIIIEQSKLANHFYCVVLNNYSNHYDIQRISESVWFIPTNSWISWLAPFDCLRIVRRELFFRRNLQIDLVVAYDPCESGLAGFLLNIRYGKPLHVHIEQNVFLKRFIMSSFGNAVRGLIARSVVRVASGIQATSENIRASLAEISVKIADRAVIFPHFVDVEAYQNEPIRVDLKLKYPQFKFIILSVIPRLASQDTHLILKVFSAVLSKYPHTGMIIVCGGISRYFLRLHTIILGVSDNVVIEKPSDNLVSYLKTSHVFFMPAIYDDNDNLIEKASACGCPVICTSIGIAPLIISSGDSGFLCEIRDVQCFISSITKLITDSGIRDRINLNSSLFLQDIVGGTKDGYLRLIQDTWKLALKETP